MADYAKQLAEAQADLARTRAFREQRAAALARTVGTAEAPAAPAAPEAPAPVVEPSAPAPRAPIMVPEKDLPAIRAMAEGVDRQFQASATLRQAANTLREAARPTAFPGKSLPEILTAPVTSTLDTSALEKELADRQKVVSDLDRRISGTRAQDSDIRDALQAKRDSAQLQLGVTRFLLEVPKRKPSESQTFSDRAVAKGKELYEKTKDQRLLPLIGQQEEKRSALYTMGKAEAEGIAKALEIPFDETRIGIGFDTTGRLTVDSAQYEAPLFFKEREDRAKAMGFSSYAAIPEEFEAAFKSAQMPDASPSALQQRIMEEANAATKAKVQKAFQRQRNISLYDPDPESTNLTLASYPPFIREALAVTTPIPARTQTPTATEFMPERVGSRFLRAMNIVGAPLIARAKLYGESDRAGLSGLSDERAAEILANPVAPMRGSLAGFGILDAVLGGAISRTAQGMTEAAVGSPDSAGNAASSAGLLALGITEDAEEAVKLVAEIRKDPSAMMLLKDLSQKAYDEATDYKGDPTTRTLIGLGFGGIGLAGLDFAMPDPAGGAVLLLGMGGKSLTSVSRQMDRISDVARTASEAEDFGTGMKGLERESPAAAMIATQMVGVDSLFNADIQGKISAATRKAAETQSRLDRVMADAAKKGLIAEDGTINDIALAREAAVLKEEAMTAQLEAAVATSVATQDALDNFAIVSKPTLVVTEKNIRQYKTAAELYAKRQTRLDTFVANNKATFEQIDALIEAERVAQEAFAKADEVFTAAQQAKLTKVQALGQAITKAEQEVAAAADAATKAAAQRKLSAAKAALTRATKETDPLNTALVKARNERQAAEEALQAAAGTRAGYMGRPGVDSARQKWGQLTASLDGPKATMDALGSALMHQGFDLAKLDDVLPERVIFDKLASELKDAREAVKVLKEALKNVGTKELEKALEVALKAETEAMRANRWRKSLQRFSDMTREGGRQYQTVVDLYRQRDAKFIDVLGPEAATKPTAPGDIARLVWPDQDGGFLRNAVRRFTTKPNEVAEALLARQDELGEVLRKIEEGVGAGKRVPLTEKEVTLIQQRLPDLAREADLAVQDDAFQFVRGIRLAETGDPNLAPKIGGKLPGGGFFFNPRAIVPALMSRYRAVTQGMDPVVAGTGVQVNEVLANVVRLARNMSAQVDDEMMTLIRRADFNNLDADVIRKVADLVGYDLEGRKLKDEVLPGLLEDIRAKLRNRIVLTTEEANLVQTAAIVQYLDTTKGLVYPGGKTFINTLSDQTVWQNGRWQYLHDPRLPEMLGLKPQTATPPTGGTTPPAPPTTVVPPTPVPPTPPAPPTTTTTPPTTTGLAGVGGAATAISDNMYEALLQKALKGDITENGQPSALLQLAVQLAKNGVPLDVPFMRELGTRYAAVRSAGLTGKEYQTALRKIVDELSPPTTVETPPLPPVDAAAMEKVRKKLDALERAIVKFGKDRTNPERMRLLGIRRELRKEYLAFSRGYGDLPPSVDPVAFRKSPLPPDDLAVQQKVWRRDPMRKRLETELSQGAPLSDALKIVDEATDNDLHKLIINRLLEDGEVSRARVYIPQRGDRVFQFPISGGWALPPRNPGDPVVVLINGSTRGSHWKPGRAGEVVIHEAVHAATQIRLDAALAKSATPELKAARTNLDTLFKGVKAAAKKEGSKFYGLTDLDEFLAEGLSNAEFQAFLKSVKVGKTTLWGKFTEAVARLLGLTEESAFTQLYAEFEKLMEAMPNEQVRQVYWKDRMAFDELPAGRGAPSASLGTQAVQTNSPAFQRWFGESKVVDAEGKPRVVYHGTAGDTEFFDALLLGEGTGAESARRGFFFASSPKVASGYGLLSMSRPSLRNATYRAAAKNEMLAPEVRQALLDASEQFSDQDVLDSGWYDEAGGGVVGANVVPTYLSIQNPLVVDFKGSKYRERTFADLIAQARAEGRDGAIFRNTFDAGHKEYDEMTDVYVVFEPTQIKSAVANTGDFSRTDRGIRAAPGTIETPPPGKLDPNSPEVMDPARHPPDDINAVPSPPPGMLDEADEVGDVVDEADDLMDELDEGGGGGKDGGGTTEPEPEGPKGIEGEAYVEPQSFRALVRAWLPSSPNARLSTTDVAALERRAYGLLKKNAEENGDFFSFMKDLQQLTYGRVTPEGKPSSGFLKTDERYARVFGFAGRAVAHAAILRSADDAIRLGTMPITRDQAQAAIKILGGEYETAGDFVAALRVFNTLGQPATVTSAVRSTEMGQAMRTTVGLLRLSENPAGQDVWTTTFMLQELEDNLPRIIKELDARTNRARSPVLDGATWFTRQYISAWKTSAVTGLLLPNPRYYLNNIAGDLSQMWFEMGGYQATKQSFTNLPVQIPLIGNAIQINASKLSNKLGGVPVLGSVFNALFNPYLSRVWDGSKGSIRLKNGAVFSYDDLRRWLVEDGILDTFVHEELLQSFSEVVPTVWNRTFGGWQRHLEQHANFVQQRQRSGLYLDLIRQGYTRAEAKRLTLNALYDWKNGMGKGELRGLANNIAFYRFWRLALKQFNNGLFEGLTTAKPGDYMRRALRGETAPARMRNIATLTDRVISPAIQQPEDRPENLDERLDDMARAIYPTWMVGRGPTFSYRLNEEARRQFQVTQGRAVSDAAITMPRMTPLDSLALYSAFVGPMIAGAQASVTDMEMSPDWRETRNQTFVEQFDPVSRLAVESLLGVDQNQAGDVRVTPAEALILDKSAAIFGSTPYRDPETGEFRANRWAAASLRATPLLGMQMTRVADDALTNNPSGLVAFDRSQKIAKLRAAAQLETNPEERLKFAEAAQKLDAQQGDSVEDAAAWFFTRSLGVGPYPYSVDQINTSLGKNINEDIKAQGEMAAMPAFQGYITGQGEPVEAEAIMNEVMGE